MEDKFVCIKVITSQKVADKACTALEEAGIPVMLQHLELQEGDLKALGFRVFTPSRCVQNASKIVDRFHAAA
jgi:hypothetical protein